MERALSHDILNPNEQKRLEEGSVFLLGLGGLGGSVLEQLLRLGVGAITGADGAVFRPSDFNRNALCTALHIGMSKAEAARDYASQVNPAVRFRAIPRFVRGQELADKARRANVLIDTVGTLEDHLAIADAAKQAEVPLVCANVSGLSGWVAVVEPGTECPASYLHSEQSTQGVLAPVVMFTAALQVIEVVKILVGRPTARGVLRFDLAEQSFSPLRFSSE